MISPQIHKFTITCATADIIGILLCKNLLQCQVEYQTKYLGERTCQIRHVFTTLRFLVLWKIYLYLQMFCLQIYKCLERGGFLQWKCVFQDFFYQCIRWMYPGHSIQNRALFDPTIFIVAHFLCCSPIHNIYVGIFIDF